MAAEDAHVVRFQAVHDLRTLEGGAGGPYELARNCAHSRAVVKLLICTI
jgi:hypothetical protein